MQAIGSYMITPADKWLSKRQVEQIGEAAARSESSGVGGPGDVKA